MTTDQTWACPICGMSTPGAHGCVGPSTVTPLPATVGQPTPTSSLEEARKALRAAEHRWATYLATAQERNEIIASLDKATADLEAAARAEVIREVEAVLSARSPEGDFPAWGHYRGDSPWQCGFCDSTIVNPYDDDELAALVHDESCPIARLRVLSQGGEGKA